MKALRFACQTTAIRMTKFMTKKVKYNNIIIL
jgi:hypothetical protein